MKSFIYAIAISTTLLPLGLVLAEQPTPLSDKDQLSYAMGVETAKSFKQHNVNIDLNTYLQGMQDVFDSHSLKMTDKAITQTLMDFQKQQLAERSKQLEQQAEKNQKASDTFLANNKTKPDVTTMDNGIQYTVITAGKGVKPSMSDTVTVDYEGSLPDGTVFDSSYQRGKPATFPLNAVIQGWQEALTQMPTGSTWKIVIPPNLAYGSSGTPDGSIEPNEALIFKVHLISIKKAS